MKNIRFIIGEIKFINRNNARNRAIAAGAIAPAFLYLTLS